MAPRMLLIALLTGCTVLAPKPPAGLTDPFVPTVVPTFIYAWDKQGNPVLGLTQMEARNLKLYVHDLNARFGECSAWVDGLK